MFKFFKEKLKNTVDKFSKSVKSEVEDFEEIEKEIEESDALENSKEILEDVKETLEKPIDVPRVIVEDLLKEEKIKQEIPTIQEEPEIKQKDEKTIEDTKPQEEFKEKIVENKEIKTEIKKIIPKEEPIIKEEKVKKPSFFEKLTSKKISEEKFEELFWELEIMLLENNVSMKVIDKIKSDLKEKLVEKQLKRGKIVDTIQDSLKQSIKEVLDVEKIDLDSLMNEKPFVICFLGINGSGKTTTIAKFANMLLKKNKTIVLAAADTFRAAAIDQLQEHADKLNVKLIKHDYGSDPAAVAYDAIKHAKAKKIDVVLIDTAGRMHSNINLLDEMKKIIRIAQPNLKIFVGESITGNDCVEQAEKFDETVGIDGVILSKADIDEKGGAAISISYVTKKPILFLGTGQNYDDIETFNYEKVLETLGL